jgi:hypothetical protein
MPRVLRPTALLASLLLLAHSGCVSTLVIKKLGKSLAADRSMVYTGEEDPQLVADALPFALKVYESLLEKQPRNPDLLLAAGRGFTLYAFAFVQVPAQMLPSNQAGEQKVGLERSRAMYERAQGYLLTALDATHPGLKASLLEGKAKEALAAATAADTALLYWTATAWLGSITAATPTMGALMGLPKAVALIDRLNELNPTYDLGSAHELLISYFAAAPASKGGEKRSREEFARALELSKGCRSRPYVNLATGVSLKNGDKAEFVDLLNKALAVDTRERTRDRLANLVYQGYARWLLANADSLMAAGK